MYKNCFAFNGIKEMDRGACEKQGVKEFYECQEMGHKQK
jgi:hypothetical protein